MNKLKWVKDLNVRPETIKLLEENTVWFLTSVLIIFLNLSPQVRESKVKTKQKKQIGPNQTKKLLHDKGYHQP